MITGKQFPVFDYSGGNIVTIFALKKEIQKEFARVQKLTLSSSQWIGKQNQTRYGYVNL